MKGLKVMVAIVMMMLVTLTSGGCNPTAGSDQTVIVKGDPNNPDPGTDPINDVWMDVYQNTILSIPKVEIRWCTLYVGDLEICQADSGHATGFVVAPGVIATANHVVWSADWVDTWNLPNAVGYFRYFVHYPASNSLYGTDFIDQAYEVTGIYQLPDRDIALLQVETLDRAPLELGPNWADVPLISEVMALGYPLDFNFNASQGRINAKPSNEEYILPWVTWDTKLIKHDAFIDAGNSGGPLLNDQGQVIGVNIGVYTYYTEHFLAVTTEYLKGVNLDNVPWWYRDLPRPEDWTTTTLLNLSSHIEPVNEAETYVLSLNSNCSYRFETWGVLPTPIDTWMQLEDGSYTYINQHPNGPGQTTHISWSPWNSGSYFLTVRLDTDFSSTPGDYNLLVEQYCR